jgi:hypothetical protein
VTDRTPDEILNLIDKALEDAEKTATRLNAAKPKPRRYPVRRTEPDMRSKTPEEILEAIDNALEETHRRLTQAEAAVDDARETTGRT